MFFTLHQYVRVVIRKLFFGIIMTLATDQSESKLSFFSIMHTPCKQLAFQSDWGFMARNEVRKLNNDKILFWTFDLINRYSRKLDLSWLRILSVVSERRSKEIIAIVCWWFYNIFTYLFWKNITLVKINPPMVHVSSSSSSKLFRFKGTL